MYKYKIFLFTSLVIILNTSCSNLLDKEPVDYIKSENALTTVSALETALNGAYSELQSTNYYGRNLIVLGDLLADNTKIAPQNSDKFISFYNHSFTAAEPEILGLWESCYKVINRSNAIIAAIPNFQKDKDSLTVKQIHAEALCLRALAYFDLFKTFSLPYKINSYVEGADGNGGHLSIPIILDPISADSLVSPSKSKATDVKDVITKDLNASLELFNTSKSPLYFSKEAAQALLAKFYYYIKDDVKAFNLCKEIILSKKYELVPNEEFVESWSKEYTSESIFSVAMTQSDYNGTDALGYLYLRNGYNDIIPTQDLIKLYDPNDIRTKLIDKSTEIRKYPGRAGITGLDNIPVIRYAEILLIYAEITSKYTSAQAAGNEAYNIVAFRANPKNPPSTIVGRDLIPYIKLERRKELAFEGHRYFELMADQSSIVRNDCSAYKCEITFPSTTCVLPIPQHEMNANPNMVQNPGF